MGALTVGVSRATRSITCCSVVPLAKALVAEACFFFFGWEAEFSERFHIDSLFGETQMVRQVNRVYPALGTMGTTRILVVRCPVRCPGAFPR